MCCPRSRSVHLCAGYQHPLPTQIVYANVFFVPALALPPPSFASRLCCGSFDAGVALICTNLLLVRLTTDFDCEQCRQVAQT